MVRRPQVLVATQNAAFASQVFGWLSAAGYDLALVTTFSSARLQMDAGTDLIIADVKLGAFNGLHLALRALTSDVPAIIIGPADPVLEHEAHAIEAHYVSGLPDKASLLALVATLTAHTALSPAPNPELDDEAAMAPPASGVMWQTLADVSGRRAQAWASALPRSGRRLRSH